MDLMKFDKYLKTSKVASIFNCHVETIRRWTEAGIFKNTIKIGNQYRYAERDIKKVLKQMKIKAWDF